MGSCACLVNTTNNSTVEVCNSSQNPNEKRIIIERNSACVNNTPKLSEKITTSKLKTRNQYSNILEVGDTNINKQLKHQDTEKTTYEKKQNSINSDANHYIPNKEKEKEEEEEEIKSQYNFSQRSISRFLNRDYINIVLLGGKGVGKSAFVIRYINSVFEKLYIPTLGSEFQQKKLAFNNHSYTINFTVTAGNTYKSDYSKAYASSDFFFAFFDVTSMLSYIEIRKTIKTEIKDHLYSYGSTINNIILVGNKIDDSNRKVPSELVQKYCDEHNFQYFEISVKSNKNIPSMMKSIIKTVDDNSYPTN